MDQLIHLSNQLGQIPAHARVAAVYGVSEAQYIDALVIQDANGDERCQLAPAGSRAWLRALFPQLTGQTEIILDEDFNVYTFRFSTFQNALVVKTLSRELCAQACGVLS